MADGKDPGPRGHEDEDEPGWVSTLVSVGGALGMNRTRLRWKLRRFVRERRGHRSPMTGVSTTLLALAMLVVFVAMAAAQSGGTSFELYPWVMVAHGANLPGASEPVRDLTSLFVHDGVFHALLGMFTVAMVGGLLERELSWSLVIPVFLVAGGAGAAASDALGRDGLGAGAAAGVCGLIGAGAMIGQRMGTRRGLTYRNELLSVGVLVVGFGLFVGTDYLAVVPAAATGALLAWALPRAAFDEQPWLARAVGVAGIGALAAVVVVAAGAKLT